MKKKSTVAIQNGSGNIFTDLALPRPEIEQLKAELTLQIYRIIQEHGYTQNEAAKILGIRQPHVSALMRNRPGTFAIGRLMEFLTALGHDVLVTVKPTGRRKQHGEVSVALG